jgi:cytochrome oxidase assembly protein ShyY1
LESLYLGAYLELADDGTHSKDLVLAKRPDITEGNHLSYAFQWVLFALMAFVAIAINVRRDLDEKRAAEDASYVPKPKRKRVGDDDKAAEDALLDGLAE